MSKRCRCTKKIESVIASRFKPTTGWLPPRFKVVRGLEKFVYIQSEELERKFRLEEAKRSHPNFFDVVTVNDVAKLVASSGIEEGRNELLATIEARMLQMEIPPLEERFTLREGFMVPTKTFADVAESLIGLFLKRLGPTGAIEFMAWLGLDLDPVREISELLEEPSNTSGAWLTDKTLLPESAVVPGGDVEGRLTVALQKINIEKVEEILGYAFLEKSFLLQALTHSSYIPNRSTSSNERLEFLGDALINFIATCRIFCADATLTPREIHVRKHFIVSSDAQAKICLRNGLHKHLLRLSPCLDSMINDYVKASGSLGLAGPAPKPLKVMADVVEAIVAAVYLDSRGDLGVVWKVLKKLDPQLEGLLDRGSVEAGPAAGAASDQNVAHKNRRKPTRLAGGRSKSSKDE